MKTLRLPDGSQVPLNPRFIHSITVEFSSYIM